MKQLKYIIPAIAISCMPFYNANAASCILPNIPAGCSGGLGDIIGDLPIVGDILGDVDNVLNSTVDTMSGGTLTNLTGSLISNLTGGSITNVTNSTIDSMTGGLVGDLTGGSGINSLLGGTLSSLDGGLVHTLNGGTVNAFNGGTIDTVLSGTVSELLGGVVNNLLGGELLSMTGGEVSVLDDTATIDLMNGGTIGSMLGGVITSLADGTVLSMDGGTVGALGGLANIAVMNDGTVNSIDGGSITKLLGGTILSMDDGEIKLLGGLANVNEMNGGTIYEMLGGTIGSLLGGNIISVEDGHLTVLGGTASIGDFSGGTIDDVQGGTIDNMTGGTIDNMTDGDITNLNNGTIATLDGGSIANMNGGQITDMKSGDIAIMNDGKIGTVEDGTIDSVRGGTIGSVSGGTLTYDGTSAKHGTITGNVTGGNINVNDNGYIELGGTDYTGGAFALGNGSTMHFTNSAAIGDLDASGAIIDLRNPGNPPASLYDTLTVANWTAADTKVYMNTYFDGDDDLTDLLTVTGTATGDSTLFITSAGATNRATPEGANGIKVVDLANPDQTATFALNGGQVDTGALVYKLIKGDDGDWYLHSDGTISGTAHGVARAPTMQLAVVKSGMNELRKRLGDLRADNANRTVGPWVRAYGSHIDMNKGIDSGINMLGVEGGIDWVRVRQNDRMFFGLMAGYSGSGDISATSNGNTGTGSITAPSIGAYFTWLNKSGWAFDATVRNFWVDSNITSNASGGTAVKYDIQRDFLAGSLELGRRFNADRHATVEPKVELRYMYAGASDHMTSQQNQISYDATNSFTTKASVQFNYLPSAEDSVWKPWIELGVYNDWGGTTNTQFAGVKMGQSDAGGFGLLAAVGANAQISDRTYGYGGFTLETGEVYTAYTLNLGLRSKF